MLLTEDRKIKVLDLGLGVLMEADNNATFATADGIAVGTVDYMSPEQAWAREVDGRSDLYSLGCAMYHLMTGKSRLSPASRRSSGWASGSAASPSRSPSILPDLPPPVVRVIDKLMAYKPQERYSTATRPPRPSRT